MTVAHLDRQLGCQIMEVRVGDWVVYTCCKNVINEHYNKENFILGHQYEVTKCLPYSGAIYVKTIFGDRLLDSGEFSPPNPLTLDDCM